MNFDFASMLQDPAVREKLLNNLAMSPLDPAAALQQIGQQGMMQPPPATPPGVQGIVPNMPPPVGVNPGAMFGQGGPGVQLPPGAFPGGPQVPGMPPQAPTPAPGMGVQAGNLDFRGDGLVPGEPQGAAGGFDAARMKAALSGLAGMQQQGQGQPLRAAPSTPGGMPTRAVDMRQLQIAPPGQRVSLADLIYRRG